MKWLIASDIHGSARFSGQLLNAWKREGRPRILLLGDILYHGPRNDLPEEYDPRQVIAMLNPLRDSLQSVRGNCEAEVDQMVLDFPAMADYCLLPLEEHLVFCTHGHLYGEGNLPPLRPGDSFLYGHTHVPRAEKKDGIWMLNPGSVSIPKEGSRHSYATLEGNMFTVRDLQTGDPIMRADLS